MTIGCKSACRVIILVFGIFDHPGINHHPEVVSGVLEEESRTILQEFFRSRRG